MPAMQFSKACKSAEQTFEKLFKVKPEYFWQTWKKMDQNRENKWKL